MRYLSLYLYGYGGIYNGMGLNEIYIDFRICKYKTIVIRGENGSGKSTIFNALSVLPDHNDKFIPGMPAKKEVYLQDGLNTYCITFNHPVGANGKRGTTEAFIKKSTNGSIFIELNESGNVTSFKDILYDELSLDANFIALSQLSMDDKGLATKRPAERKKFVNSIISSLDTYNGIYKTLSKRSSIYKSMIDSIVTKMGQLGDENLLNSNYMDLESRSLQLNAERDQLLELLGKCKSDVLALDTDGSIRKQYDEAEAKKKQALSSINAINKSIQNVYSKNEIDPTVDPVEALASIRSKRSSLEVDNQILKSKKTSLLADSESQYKEITQKQARLNQLGDDDRYQEIFDKIATYEAENAEIYSNFYKANIDISSFTKDEFILALNILKSTADSVQELKGRCSYESLESTIDIYKRGEKPTPVLTISRTLEDARKTKSAIEKRIEELEKDLECISILKSRPSGCKFDDCAFLIQVCGKNTIGMDPIVIQSELDKAKQSLIEVDDIIASCEAELVLATEINDIYRGLTGIINSMTPAIAIMKKLPNGSSYSDPLSIVENLMTSDFLYNQIQDIYSYIELADMIYVYNNNLSIIEKLKAELQVQLNKREIVDSIIEEINSLNRKVQNLREETESIESTIRSNDFMILKYTSQESQYETIIQLYKDKETSDSLFAEASDAIKNLDSKMEAIKIGLTNIDMHTKHLEAFDRDIQTINRERDKIRHSLELHKEYKEEYAKLSRQYEIIDTIKYYSSPTTGIQLVFMELYMGNIINLANELLQLLFNGAFQIQPFIINDTEFRIPCMGSDRIMNDDISSMSSAQLCMISMVLSFSLLYHSSTKYNIIKLDEIDAPLDENKRLMFIDVLDRIMSIMNTEQCILISHNSELQVDSSDVILLKTSEGFSTEYNRGNIIWRYN